MWHEGQQQTIRGSLHWSSSNLSPAEPLDTGPKLAADPSSGQCWIQPGDLSAQLTSSLCPILSGSFFACPSHDTTRKHYLLVKWAPNQLKSCSPSMAPDSLTSAVIVPQVKSSSDINAGFPWPSLSFLPCRCFLFWT